MSYTILYSSRTGNTRLLAEALSSCFPGSLLISASEFLSKDSKASDPLISDLVFAGFWTDRGTCDQEMKEVLSSLRHKKILLFGTAGFGREKRYFDQVLERASEAIPSDSQYLSGFMCQGKMPQAVRNRYERIAADASDSREVSQANAMLENFDQALSHPDQDDLTALTDWAVKAVSSAGA